MNKILQWARSHKELSFMIIIGLEAVALLAILALLFTYDGENHRLKKNQPQLSALVGVEICTSADGKSMAETQALNMKVSELEASRDTLLNTVKNRRLLALAQAATASEASAPRSMPSSSSQTQKSCI